MERCSMNWMVSGGVRTWGGVVGKGNQLRASALQCFSPALYSILPNSAQRCSLAEAIAGVALDGLNRCISGR